MSTIVLRSVKGTPLTNAEVDANFTNLNNDKTELGGTYSSGTANGVLFLSSSKVLTTGSALTFDGTKLGVTAASGNAELQLVRPSGFPGNFTLTAGGASTDSNITLYDTTSGYVAAYRYVGGASGYHNWFQNNTEQMRLTSTGLGIGTSSPAYKLDVNGSARATDFKVGAALTELALFQFSGVSYLGNNYAANLVFRTNAADRLTLDASGNLGLGVTPSAWNTVRVFQFGNASLYGNSTADASFTQNAFFQSGWKYIGSAAASQYMQNGGSHLWYTAPSGTAGNAISFTQAMTLGANGNLAVGDTSTGNARLFSYISDASLASINARQDGVGPIQVWNSGGVERARIDSSGNLLVGQTSVGLNSVVSSGGFHSRETAQFNINSTNSSTQFEWVMRTGTEMQFYVSDATVMARLTASGVWTDASDARYKENIRPVPYGLAEVMQLQPRTYNVIGSARQEIGFVAQEVEPLIPELVESTKNSVTEEDRLTLSYGQLSAVLVKAIQELKAEFDAYKASHP